MGLSVGEISGRARISDVGPALGRVKRENLSLISCGYLRCRLFVYGGNSSVSVHESRWTVWGSSSAISLGVNDAERADIASKGIMGKRLTYRRTVQTEASGPTN